MIKELYNYRQLLKSNVKKGPENEDDNNSNDNKENENDNETNNENGEE